MQINHKHSNPLRDVILGGQDGLVNILGIALGFSAVSSDTRILIATGLAATFAEAISMVGVAYTSALSQRHYYEKEKQEERGEVNLTPQAEKNEIRDIYLKKGFQGKRLDSIVDTITANQEVWVDVMMQEELQLVPIVSHDILKSSAIVGIATVIGSLIPLLPFFVLAHISALTVSIGISAIALFAVGAYEAKSLVGDWKKSGMRMVVIGIGAAFIGFLIARLFTAFS